MESFLKFSYVWKMWISSSYQRPPEKFESRFVWIEKLSSIIVINLVDINRHQSEADVDNHENEEENQDIDNHVGHGDYNGSGLTPHETSLKYFYVHS